MNTKINGKKVIIFGGTGFIGSHLINSLCKNSCQVDVVTRKNIKKLDFFIGNEPGQVRIVKIEKFQKDQLDQIITGSEILFNLIGILYEKKKGDFIKAHIDIPRELAASASRVGLRNFIHVSA
ncbi:MAG: NAD-dependent epimerase/dehydratase family protein, partial [Alphaproteobacteria bacterium]